MAKDASTRSPVKKISAARIMLEVYPLLGLRQFYEREMKRYALAMARITYEPPAT